MLKKLLFAVQILLVVSCGRVEKNDQSGGDKNKEVTPEEKTLKKKSQNSTFSVRGTWVYCMPPSA